MPNHNFQNPDFGNGRRWEDVFDSRDDDGGENPFLALQAEKSGRRSRRASKGRDRQRGENRANRW